MTNWNFEKIKVVALAFVTHVLGNMLICCHDDYIISFGSFSPNHTPTFTLFSSFNF